MIEILLTLLFVAAAIAATIGAWMLIMRLLWPLVRRIDARGLAKEAEEASQPKTSTRQRGEISGAGLAISLAGAGLMLLGVFLPWAESSSFARIEENTVIQSGYGAFWVVWSVVIVSGIFGSRRSDKVVWSVFGFGLVGIAVAIYSGTGDRLLLESVAGFSGPGTRGTVQASPGIGIYATGIGSALVAAGGWLLAQEDRTTSPDPSTRVCPECKFEVPAEASVCGHCRNRLPDEPNVAAS